MESHYLLKDGSNDYFSLVAENGKIFDGKISSNVKEKIGDLSTFINYVKKSKSSTDNMFIEFLSNRSKKLNVKINAYDYYWDIGKFLIDNLEKSNLKRILNFDNLYIFNTELGTTIDNGIKFDDALIYHLNFYQPPLPSDFFKNVVMNNSLTANNILPKDFSSAEIYALKYKKTKFVPDLSELTGEYRRKYLRNFCEKWSFNSFYNVLKDKLKSVLNTNHKIAITDIPSSTMNAETTLSLIIKNLSEECDNIIDASNLLYRSENKETAHGENKSSSKSRDINENIRTMGVVNNFNMDGVEAIIVLDDVTTTGHSFIAADSVIKTYLKNNNFNMPIINISYGRTVHEFYNSINPNKLIFSNDKIKGIIFDVDRTLIDKMDHISPVKDKKEWSKLYDLFGEVSNNIISIKLFKYISSLCEKGINIYYLSNRPRYVLNPLFRKIIGPIDLDDESAVNKIIPINDMTTGFDGYLNKHNFDDSKKLVTTANKDFKRYRPIKPSSYYVNKIINDMNIGETRSIIGIGNQQSDMIAYYNSGIEPIMVNWFNEKNDDKNVHPIPCIDYNNNFKTFEDFENFEKYINERI